MNHTKILSFLHRRADGKLSIQRVRHASTYQMMNLATVDCLDPYTYTSGRWLYRDDVQRQARHKIIDFKALCKRVVEVCPGARAIACYDKKEGGFNRVFLFTTDDGKRIVARLPFAFAGPPSLTTASEVATIRYLQSRTTIPIPKIIDWSDNASNTIGSEYIIMEHAAGVQLHQVWPTMGGDQQVKCINNIYQKIKEAVDMSFPAYGSLYFINAQIKPELKTSLDHDFCIGPHCGPIFWDCDIGKSRNYIGTKPNQGPWSTLKEWCDGLIDTGLSRVPPTDAGSYPTYQGSVAEHVSLLQSCHAVIQRMSQDSRIQQASTPTLLHPDLHKRNIFVSEEDPTNITAIIDWQSASVEPAFWYADTIPDFASATAHPTLEGELEPGSERCAQTFDLCTKYLTPKISGPRMLNDALFRPFRYCYRTWNDGAVALRNELIETSQQWSELGFAGFRPYILPRDEKLETHRKEFKTFEAAQALKSSLSSLLDTASDGWVPPEEWESKKLAQRELFHGMLQAVLANIDPDDEEPIRSEEDLRAIWPFDI